MTSLRERWRRADRRVLDGAVVVLLLAQLVEDLARVHNINRLIREWDVLSIRCDDLDRTTIHKTRNRASPD